ncbi:hypothetical protein ACLKA7_013954 [Drosophila subpalustris]
MEPAKSVDSGMCCLHHCNTAPQQHCSLADAETTVGLSGALPCSDALTCAKLRREMTIKMLSLIYRSRFEQSLSLSSSLSSTPQAKTRSESVGGPPPPSLG